MDQTFFGNFNQNILLVFNFTVKWSTNGIRPTSILHSNVTSLNQMIM